MAARRPRLPGLAGDGITASPAVWSYELSPAFGSARRLAAWAEVARHVTDPGQQVEFIIAMGNWMMFSMLFRNLRIPLADGVAVWPPDGLASPAAQG